MNQWLMKYFTILIACNLLLADQGKFEFWPQEHYGISIPPTNTTLLKQEHQRQEKKQLENINAIVERVVKEDLEDGAIPSRVGERKKKKRKKNVKQCGQCCSTGQAATTKATVDLLVPEIRSLLDQQYEDQALTQNKITVKLHEISLRKAVDLIAKMTGVNFVMDADVEGFVRNFSFNKTPLSAVMALLLSNNMPRLTLIKDRGVWRILKQVTAIEECKVRAEKSIEQDTIAACIATLYVSWNPEFKKRIEQLWQGIIGNVAIKSHYLVFDDESRKIFCRGRSSFVQDFKKAISEIDIDIPQVRIDARIVMASKDFEESLGFEWSGMYDRSAHLGNNAFGFAGIGIGEKNNTDPAGFSNLLGWALNFIPTTIRNSRTIQIPFSFGNKNLSTSRLNIMLNAAEDKKEMETILKPSLLVRSQEVAEILVGEEMPQETRLQETVEGSPTNVTTISYKDIGMKIKVKPVVAPDKKAVFLDIFVQNSYVDQSSVTVSNNPNISTMGSFPYTIVTSRSSNRVVLRDGQTTMISGLIENSKKRSQTGVPWIQEIPVLGWFFKGKRKRIQDKQLLIFITPTLIT